MHMQWGMLLMAALLLAACTNSPAPQVWRNPEGIEVDPIYGTTVPGRPATY